ncbi:Uu.00g040970.m01.CDS01 [Anthostomella pinea]|uniref:Uu.00g040970.m01.CDS01 n=1 Tax=Anthostomella pinea TaxID=933095 RepID=A0AAI8VAA0_9PEZI|nr:Uu.00g040970.m01.CDS01 [Anthostomella pinea]
MSLQLQLHAEHCRYCGTRDDLTPCLRCKHVHFCKHHRGSKDHKVECSRLFNGYQQFIAFEAMQPLNHQGVKEWSIPFAALPEASKSSYMAHCLNYATNLLQIDQVQRQELALALLSRVCSQPDGPERPRKIGRLAARMPCLLLRLGKDQECYHFCKWWNTPSTNWRSKQVAELWNEPPADRLESVDFMLVQCSRGYLAELEALRLAGCDIAYYACIILVKIRILVKLDKFGAVDTLMPKYATPQEIADMIKNEILDDDSIPNRHRLWPREAYTTHIANLNLQIRQLVEGVSRCLPHFWPELLRMADSRDPITLQQEKSQNGTWGISGGSRALKHTFRVWQETPGAIEMVRKIVSAQRCELKAVAGDS